MRDLKRDMDIIEKHFNQFYKELVEDCNISFQNLQEYHQCKFEYDLHIVLNPEIINSEIVFSMTWPTPNEVMYDMIDLHPIKRWFQILLYYYLPWIPFLWKYYKRPESKLRGVEFLERELMANLHKFADKFKPYNLKFNAKYHLFAQREVKQDNIMVISITNFE